jgi:hypothetical protein
MQFLYQFGCCINYGGEASGSAWLERDILIQFEEA